MLRRRKKGFTLIELIVVIAIIGVLAAILVPTMIGYVKKSKRAADVSSAREIFVEVVDIIGEDDNASSSLYSGGSTVYKKHDTIENADYDLVLVGYLDGLSGTDGTGNVWTPVDADNKDFCDALNQRMDFNTASNTIKVKIKTKDSDIGTLNRWFVGYRKDDPNTIEVWVGDANKGGCGEPLTCMYAQINKSTTSAS